MEQIKPKMKCRGYISSRKTAGNFIPQRVQNLVIRDYAEKHQLKFLLSATEYAFDDFFHVFNGIYDEIESIDGVIFYSLDMLPRDYSSQKSLLTPLLDKNKKIFFSLENIKLTNSKDLYILKEISMIKHILRDIN